MLLSDKDFQYQFEQKTLDPKYFNNVGHLRIAWIYINQSSLDSAIEQITTGIQAYANSLGAKDKFHYTLTEATVRLMQQRIERENSQSFEGFLSENPDMVSDLRSLINTYYSEGLLSSSVAKHSFVEPDLKSMS